MTGIRVPREAFVDCGPHHWPVRIEAIQHEVRQDYIDVSFGRVGHLRQPGLYEEELLFELKIADVAISILMGDLVAPNASLLLPGDAKSGSPSAGSSIFFDSARPHPDGGIWFLATVRSSFPAGSLEFDTAIWQREKVKASGRSRIVPVPEKPELIRLPNRSESV